MPFVGVIVVALPDDPDVRAHRRDQDITASLRGQAHQLRLVAGAARYHQPDVGVVSPVAFPKNPRQVIGRHAVPRLVGPGLVQAVGSGLQHQVEHAVSGANLW